MKRFLLVLLVGSLAMASSKPKIKVYPTSCVRVWNALKVATNPPNFQYYATLDDINHKGMITTGGILSYRVINIQAYGEGDSCSVAISGNYLRFDPKRIWKKIDESFDNYVMPDCYLCKEEEKDAKEENKRANSRQ